MPPTKNKRVEQQTCDSDIPERPICLVCVEVPEKVMLTDDCGHFFCEDCVDQLLKAVGSRCPVCKKVFYHHTVHHSLYVQREIDALPIECPSEDCNWKKERSELPAHLKTCEYVEVACPHEGCNAVTQRRLMPSHQKCCPFAIVECPHGCGATMHPPEVRSHELESAQKLL